MHDSYLHVVHHSNGLTPRQVGNQIFRNKLLQHSSLRLCSKWTVQKAPVYNLILFLLWHNWFFPVSGLYSNRGGVVDRIPGENLIFPQSESCPNKNSFSIGRGTGQCSFFLRFPPPTLRRIKDKGPCTVVPGTTSHRRSCPHNKTHLLPPLVISPLHLFTHLAVAGCTLKGGRAGGGGGTWYNSWWWNNTWERKKKRKRNVRANNTRAWRITTME